LTKNILVLKQSQTNDNDHIKVTNQLTVIVIVTSTR